MRRTTARTVPALLVLVVGAALVVAGVVAMSSPPAARAHDLRRTVPDPVVTPVRAAPGAAGEGGGVPAVGVVAPPAAPPATVRVPGVDRPMPAVPVGVLASGALQLPVEPTSLGWWTAGAAPGSDRGTVVLAGHLDSAELGAGPLEALLAPDLSGDVTVVDSLGASHRYVVASRTSYPKAELPSGLFTADGEPRLVLVTCGGAFDEATGHYEENVVVVAHRA